MMTRNICIFSDGTGQGGEIKETRSNVRKLFEACSRNATIAPLGSQICFYDPGLGSDPDAAEDKSWARYFDIAYKWAAKATGLGITANIIDCYAAILARWQPGDRIFLFGFSRGAYTVRSLGGVLSLCGVPGKGVVKGDGEAERKANVALAKEAVKNVYMAAYYAEGRTARETAAAAFRQTYECTSHHSNPADVHHDTLPYFIGVWDTVRALGIPKTSAPMKWLSKQLENLFKHEFHDSTLNPRVPFARQALAIDERREVFRPELWAAPAPGLRQSMEQHWFAGVHTDIGGGYIDDNGLAQLTLQWIVDEAEKLPAPLLADRSWLGLDAFSTPHLGRQHDEVYTSLVPWPVKDRRDFLAGTVPGVPRAPLNGSVEHRIGQHVEIMQSSREFELEVYRL
jgi:uncharacterized protein (DUF2235 family)